MQTAEFVLTSAGLTTSVTAYTSGDVLGTEITVPNFFQAVGGRAKIVAVTSTDAAAVLLAHDLFLFKAASTPAADNAANSWSDPNILNHVGTISLPTASVLVSALNTIGTWQPTCPLVVSGGTTTSLFVVAVTRSGNSFFGAATNIQWRMVVEYY